MADDAVESRRNGSRRTQYYCYNCQRTIQPILPEMTCPQCNDGFVEEMTGPGADEEITPPNYTAGNPIISPLSTLFEAFHPRPPVAGQQSAASPRQHTVVFRMGGQGQNRPLQMFMTDVGMPQTSSGSGERGASNHPRHPLEAILSQVFGGNALFPPGVHGNIGDYVWGPGGLDAIITQLLNRVDGTGPPPADEDTINNLPSRKINAAQVEKNLQCFVCFDDFSLDEEVKVLPCQHHYHQGCIEPWLKIHGTCPVCRKDLNGGDTTTQEFDHNIGETLSNLSTQTEGSSNQDSSSIASPISNDNTVSSHIPTQTNPTNQPPNDCDVD